MPDKPHHRLLMYDEPMTRKNIHLPDHLIEHAREVGGGELAPGVRRCIERDLERKRGSAFTVRVQSDAPAWAERAVRRLRREGYRALYSTEGEHVIVFADEASGTPQPGGLECDLECEQIGSKRWHLSHPEE